jgi:long-chain acyl-CoA synthetase
MWVVNEASEAGSYADRPWQSLYEHEHDGEASKETLPDILSAFESCVKNNPGEPAIVYFNRTLSFAELDELSEAFAAVLLDRGFRAGDRLALFLQNVPQFPIAALAAWKLGGVLVPINPMNTARELALILADSHPAALVAHDNLHREVVAGLRSKPTEIFSTSILDFQSRNDRRIFGSAKKRNTRAPNFVQVIEEKRGAQVERVNHTGAEVAMLVYTSGTTGVPKGSINTHHGAIVTAESIARWYHIQPGEPIVGIAPLFHVTGLVAGIVLSFVRGSRLILSYRFHPNVTADAIEEHGAVVTFCAITSLMAILHEPDVRPEQLRTLTKICTGGAPMPPAVLTQFRNKFGHYIYHGYGMTETNGPVFLVPAHLEAPVDEVTGALSVGVPTPHTWAWIAGRNGLPVPTGDLGEVVIGGTSIFMGYWQKSHDSEFTLRPDGFRSGDIGFMDANGWFYLVDRKKDMINAGGYKVWPREVEEVLYTHPAVREVAVVGVPDLYRGEIIKAVVSLKRGFDVSPEELKAFCEGCMVAEKYPRLIDIRPDLPKDSDGKILRRSLRVEDQSASARGGGRSRRRAMKKVVVRRSKIEPREPAQNPISDRTYDD